MGAILRALVWTAVDSSGTGSLQFQSVWTLLDPHGQRLEIYRQTVQPGHVAGLGRSTPPRLIGFHESDSARCADPGRFRFWALSPGIS